MCLSGFLAYIVSTFLFSSLSLYIHLACYLFGRLVGSWTYLLNFRWNKFKWKRPSPHLRASHSWEDHTYTHTRKINVNRVRCRPQQSTNSSGQVGMSSVRALGEKWGFWSRTRWRINLWWKRERFNFISPWSQPIENMGTSEDVFTCPFSLIP